MASDEQIIGSVQNALETWALGDIFKAVHANRTTFSRTDTTLDDNDAALRGAFILCSCLIDALACYRYNKEATRSDFKQFVKDYLDNRYNGIDNDLYLSMRCGLVHNYQTKNVPGNTTTKYKLTHNNHDQHLKADADGVWLNLQDVIGDVQEALTKFFAEVATAGSAARTNLLKWAKKHGWLGVKPVAAPTAAVAKGSSESFKILEGISLPGFDTSALPTSTLCYGPSGNVTPADL